MKTQFRLSLLLSLALGALLGGVLSGQAQTTNVTVDPNQGWQGYFVSTPYSSGVPISDLQAYFVPGVTPTRLLLQMNTNTYDATTPGSFDNGVVNTFDTPSGMPKVTIETDCYVDSLNFAGMYVNFSGTVESNSLPGGVTVFAFIKDYTSNYGLNSDTTAALVAGQSFNITSPATIAAGDHAQYGFVMFGSNAAPYSANAQQAVSIVTATGPAAPQVNVTVNPTPPDTVNGWIGYLTYFNTNGAYEGGFADALSNLPSAFIPSLASPARLVFGINTNTYDATATNAFDNNTINTFNYPNGAPANTLELDTYVDVGTNYDGDQVIFRGTVQSNSVPAGWSAIAFIKDWTAGYGVNVETTVPLVTGEPFTVSHTIETTHIAQYGFAVLGPNTPPNSAPSRDMVSVLVSGPLVVTPSLTGTTVNLSFQTVNGTSYTVLYKNHLTDATWLTNTTFVGDGNVDIKTDTLGAPGTTRFYRVRSN